MKTIRLEFDKRMLESQTSFLFLKNPEFVFVPEQEYQIVFVNGEAWKKRVHIRNVMRIPARKANKYGFSKSLLKEWMECNEIESSQDISLVKIKVLR